MDDRSFPLLIERLCRQHHEHTVLTMARKARIPQSTLFRWMHGLAETPRVDMLQRLCRRYDLRFEDVWALVSRDIVRIATGKRVPLPDFSDSKPGPKPKLAAGARRKR